MQSSNGLDRDEIKQLRRAAHSGRVGYIGLFSLSTSGDAAESLERRGYFRRRFGTLWVYVEFELTPAGREHWEDRRAEYERALQA